jgi:hypothetical protein
LCATVEFIITERVLRSSSRADAVLSSPRLDPVPRLRVRYDSWNREVLQPATQGVLPDEPFPWDSDLVDVDPAVRQLPTKPPCGVDTGSGPSMPQVESGAEPRGFVRLPDPEKGVCQVRLHGAPAPPRRGWNLGLGASVDTVKSGDWCLLRAPAAGVGAQSHLLRDRIWLVRACPDGDGAVVVGRKWAASDGLLPVRVWAPLGWKAGMDPRPPDLATAIWFDTGQVEFVTGIDIVGGAGVNNVSGGRRTTTNVSLSPSSAAAFSAAWAQVAGGSFYPSVGDACVALDVFVSKQRAAAERRANDSSDRKLFELRTSIVVKFLRHVGVLAGGANSGKAIVTAALRKFFATFKIVLRGHPLCQGGNRRLPSASKTTVIIAISDYLATAQITPSALGRELRLKLASARATATALNAQ